MNNQERFIASVKDDDIARLEQQLAAEKARADKAEAALAEMRAVLEDPVLCSGEFSDFAYVSRIIAHALSTSCGTGWLSPEVAAKLRKAFGMESEWPVHDVLEQLALAAEHLLHDHNCDNHGHEQYVWCLNLARQYIPRLKEALALLDKEAK